MQILCARPGGRGFLKRFHRRFVGGAGRRLLGLVGRRSLRRLHRGLRLLGRARRGLLLAPCRVLRGVGFRGTGLRRLLRIHQVRLLALRALQLRLRRLLRLAGLGLGLARNFRLLFCERRLGLRLLAQRLVLLLKGAVESLRALLGREIRTSGVFEKVLRPRLRLARLLLSGGRGIHRVGWRLRRRFPAKLLRQLLQKGLHGLRCLFQRSRGLVERALRFGLDGQGIGRFAPRRRLGRRQGFREFLLHALRTFGKFLGEFLPLVRALLRAVLGRAGGLLLGLFGSLGLHGNKLFQRFLRAGQIRLQLLVGGLCLGNRLIEIPTSLFGGALRLVGLLLGACDLLVRLLLRRSRLSLKGEFFGLFGGAQRRRFRLVPFGQSLLRVIARPLGKRLGRVRGARHRRLGLGLGFGGFRLRGFAPLVRA